MVVEIGDSELASAEKVFGARLPLAQRYVELLATSGTERGLLGPREVPRLWGRHVLNCVVVGELIPQGTRVADVGSGAGLPGLALSIGRPDLRVLLIEPLERRVKWLREVISDLQLDNVEVFRGRAEQAVGVMPVDVVTARAVSALGGLAQISIPLLEGTGELLAIKGRNAAEEVSKSSKLIRRLGGLEMSVVTVGESVVAEPTTVVRIVVGPAR